MDKILELIGQQNQLYSRIYKTIIKYERTQSLGKNEFSNLYQLIEILNKIEKDAGSIQDSGLRDEVTKWVQEERRTCDQAKDDFRLQLGQQLSKRLAETGRKVSGQYPLLRIGLYSIKFDFEFGEAVLFFGPQIERLEAGVPLSADAICAKLTDFDEKLKSSALDENIFRHDLHQVYQRLLKIEGRSYGDKVAIMKFLNEYVFIKQSKKFYADPQQKNFKGFSRVILSYDLYRFRRTGTGAADCGFHLHVATFDATVDKGSALWIPDNEDGEGTYYSYISMDKVESQ